MSWLPELSDRRQRQVLGVVLLALAGLVASALVSYREPVPGSPPWAESNASGPLGAWLAHTLYEWLGRLAAWGVPLVAGLYGWNRLRGQGMRSLTVRSAVLSLLAVEGIALIGLAGPSAAGLSGGLGQGLAGAVTGVAGPAGSAILLGALFLVTLLIASELGFSAISLAWGYLVREPVRSLAGSIREGMEGGWRSWRSEPTTATPSTAAPSAGVPAPPVATAPEPPVTSPLVPAAPARVVRPKPVGDPSARAGKAKRAEPVTEPVQEELPETKAAEKTMPDAPSAEESCGRPPAHKGESEDEADRVRVREIRDTPAPSPPRAKAQTNAIPEPVEHSGPLPSLDLVSMPLKIGGQVNDDDLQAEANQLTARLADFGIRGRVTEVHPGPVVTTFEFEPAPGVRVNSISARDDDLALAMRANRIRILAPIPGKGAVGVEIPNRKARTVYFREVLGSDSYQRTQGNLRIALGVDVNGNPRGADLTTMPHLLVAGATGAGKSVYLNALITSLLFEKGPDQLRLLMIDPKMIELAAYNGIPHLLMPVITDPKKSARSLRWAVGEMERRYKMLAKCGARNIDSFNAKVAGPSPPADDDGSAFDSLPYIVIVVDELADLMLTVANEIEEPIGRLAQMARAVGIHLVLATQRPSVDVLTGVIKANFPSRIAFQVSSKTDSRTILDMNGAENLLGRGDMLYLPGGQPQPLRVHGPFLDEADTARVVDFWRERAPEDSGPGPVEAAVERSVETEDEDEDDLVPEAVRLVVLHQQGSTSLLQRRLKVGYSRASRLMDRLEALGIVGPFMGSKARDVLVDESYLEEHSLQ